MKRRLIIGLVALGAVFAAALQQATQKADEEVTGTYLGANGDKVDVLGACSIAPDKVDCWGGDGVRSADLTKRVQQAVSTSGNTDVPFRFGRKNRIILMRASKGVSANYVYWGGFRASWNEDDGSQVMGVWVWADASEVTTQMVAQINVKPATVDLPLKTGQKGLMDDTPIEVGPIKGSNPPDGRVPGMGYRDGAPPALGKFWSVILGYAQPQGRYYDFTCTALDKDHNPIRYVDLNGEPISAVRYLALGGTTETGGFIGRTPRPTKDGEKPRAAHAIVQQTKTAAGAVQLAVNINPERIAYLRISKSKQKRVLFKGIPLDPKE